MDAVEDLQQRLAEFAHEMAPLAPRREAERRSARRVIRIGCRLRPCTRQGLTHENGIRSSAGAYRKTLRHEAARSHVSQDPNPKGDPRCVLPVP